MPDTFRQRADELRARAANEVRYLRGLARSYEELARQRGELPERANLAALLRAGATARATSPNYSAAASSRLVSTMFEHGK
jgi:hypothetical protein